MKRSTFNVQHSTSNGQPRHVNDWLHEPDAAELKRLLRRSQNCAVFGWVAFITILIAFLIVCNLR